jgi:hypothetical protein
MKTKYSSNSELVHIWANNSDPTINKSANSMSCQFDRLFSYSTCIAEIVGNTVILNTCSYSNTTSKHQNYASGAVRHLDTIRLPFSGYNHSTLVLGQDSFNRVAEVCLKDVGHYLVKASRSRKHADLYKAEALSIVENLNKYANLLNLAFSAPDLSEHQAAALRADKVRKEQDKIRKAEKIKQQAEDLVRWQAGEDVRTYFERTALRIKGDQVQTSRGANIPVADAIKLWPLLLRVKNSGKTLEAGLHSINLGPYRFNSFDGQTLIVGCHSIAWDQLALMAEQLNLTEKA